MPRSVHARATSRTSDRRQPRLPPFRKDEGQPLTKGDSMTTPANRDRSTGSGRITPGLVTTLLVVGACLVPEHSHAAKPRKLAPPWPCTMENRMEIFVDEDRIMYACECEALSTGHTCRWQVIGGVESRAVRKFKRTHRPLIIRFAHPVVTA